MNREFILIRLLRLIHNKTNAQQFQIIKYPEKSAVYSVPLVDLEGETEDIRWRVLEPAATYLAGRLAGATGSARPQISKSYNATYTVTNPETNLCVVGVIEASKEMTFSVHYS